MHTFTKVYTFTQVYTFYLSVHLRTEHCQTAISFSWRPISNMVQVGKACNQLQRMHAAFEYNRQFQVLCSSAPSGASSWIIVVRTTACLNQRQSSYLPSSQWAAARGVVALTKCIYKHKSSCGRNPLVLIVACVIGQNHATLWLLSSSSVSSDIKGLGWSVVETVDFNRGWNLVHVHVQVVHVYDIWLA